MSLIRRPSVANLLLSALVAGGVVLVPSVAQAAEPADGEVGIYVPTEAFFDADTQAEFEHEVHAFAVSHPAPALAARASEDQYRGFVDEMTDYWAIVPWKAVFGQWDCVLDEGPTVERKDADLAVLQEAHRCGDPGFASTTAGQVLPKTTTLKDAGVTRLEAQTIAAFDQRCTTVAGQAAACLEQVSIGVNRALGINYFGTTITARLRVGQSSSLTTCYQGTFITYGGTGTWTSNQTKSVQFTVSQNALWSNSFQRDAGAGYYEVVRHCRQI